MQRYTAFLLVIVCICNGCHSQQPTASASADAGASMSTDNVPPSAGTNDVRTISGHGSKGPLIDAAVELFTMNSSGYPLNGVPIASTMTDQSGDWQVTINLLSTPLLVRVSGGRYVDESDTNSAARREITLADDEFLLSVLPVNESTVAVTVHTHALVEKSRRETGAQNFAQVLAANRTLFFDAFGFDVLSVLPANPLDPQGTAEQNAYAMTVGGVANAINALAVAMADAIPSYQHIKIIADDLIDCRLDGLGVGQQIIIPNVDFSTDRLALNQEIVRFRNNNFSMYVQESVVTVDDDRCAEIGGTVDNLAPQIVAVAMSAPLDALTAQGLPVTSEFRALMLGQFSAVDDRAGGLTWHIGLPDQLALGTHTLVAEAKDDWGNVAQAQWQLQVADLSPPFIAPTSPVIVAAEGDLTLVDLPALDAHDNVTSDDNLRVTNDAPTLGFSVGQHIINWQVTDEAGHSSSVTQEVLVNSIAPVVVDPPTSLSFAGGSIDLSVYFVDPDLTSLIYTISGLPVGTGLTLDAHSGILSGNPSNADLTQQPFSVIVSASDGQSVVMLTTQLNVQPANTAPVFSLSQNSLALEEDFAPVTIQAVAASVPVHEQFQQVSYSVHAMDNNPPASFSINSETGEVSLTALSDQSGELSLVVTANDGQEFDAIFTQLLVVDIAPVNDAPEVVQQLGTLTLQTGVSFAVNLNDYVQDKDDSLLSFNAQQMPASMGVTEQGLFTAEPQPADALSLVLPISVVVTDAQGASVEFGFNLQIFDPDTDGDGLSDFAEILIDMDPTSVDTDDDGFGDSLEALFSIDPQIDSVVYLSHGGSDAFDGVSISTPFASLARLNDFLNQQTADQSVVVLVERSERPYTGNLNLNTGQAVRVIIGSIVFGDDAVQYTGTEVQLRTKLHASEGRVVSMNGCLDCRLYGLTLDGGSGGITALASTLHLEQLKIINQTTIDEGAAIAARDSNLTLENVHLAANYSSARGGAVFLADNSVMSLQHAILTGNFAALNGGAIALDGASLQVSNAVLSTNGSYGAAAVDAKNSAVAITSSTLTNNFSKSSTDALLRCVDQDDLNCAGVQQLSVSNSVVIANRALFSSVVDLNTAGISGSHNLVEAGRARFANDVEALPNARFGARYGLNQTLSAGIDAGSVSSVAQSLDNRFSKDQSPFTDAGILDLGFHDEAPLTPLVEINLGASYRRLALHGFARYAVELRLKDAAGVARPGHRMRVSVISNSAKAEAAGPSSVDINADRSRAAVDLGDGRYVVWLNRYVSVGDDQISVRVDDSTVEHIIRPSCSWLECVDNSAVNHSGLK